MLEDLFEFLLDIIVIGNVWVLIVGIALIIFFIFSAPFFCIEPELSKRVLRQSGYTNIEIKGYGWFSCGKDLFSTKYRAISPAGLETKGSVCCGIFKDCTVRIK
jgi:hypothetical protein